MQISTRTEDFIVDTLKLRIHVGPYLREVFKDPAKRKVWYWISAFYFPPSLPPFLSLSLFYVRFVIFVIEFNLIRSCMEQIETLCGFNVTLAYISAICLTLDRSRTLTLLLLLTTWFYFSCYSTVLYFNIIYNDSVNSFFQWFIQKIWDHSGIIASWWFGVPIW